MLILVISGILLVIGIILLVVSLKIDNDCMSIISGVIVGIATTCLMVAGAVAMSVQIPKENDYQKMLYERKVLEYRLDNQEENIVGGELLYADVVKFNNDLRTHKCYSDSLWIGVFYNDKIATIDYIALEINNDY